MHHPHRGPHDRFVCSQPGAAPDPQGPKAHTETDALLDVLSVLWGAASDRHLRHILFLNIVGEEFWWRGYILPRQELVHGRWTWVVHGLLWALFHLPFWWNVPVLLPSTLSLSFVVSKLKKATPGIIAHAAMNGLGSVTILLGVLDVGA